MPDEVSPVSDRRVVICNYTEGTNVASKGAKAYVVLPNYGGGYDRIQILVRSRSGRPVLKWENRQRLTNFRATTIPPEHPRYNDERLWDYEAEKLAAAISKAP